MAEEKKNEKAFTGGSYILRTKNVHPTGRFLIQKHVLSRRWQKIMLSASEEKELYGAGPSKWVEIGKPSDLEAEQKLLKRAKQLDKEPV